MPPQDSAAYGFSKQHASMPALRPVPPAYRPPPSSGPLRNSSPAEPPPYREPPAVRTVRPPHYSPPPTHRTPHLSRHPSRGSLVGPPSNRGNYHGGLPYRNQTQQQNFYQPTDYSELMNLVSAQQNQLQSQENDIKQVCHLQRCAPPGGLNLKFWREANVLVLRGSLKETVVVYFVEKSQITQVLFLRRLRDWAYFCKQTTAFRTRLFLPISTLCPISAEKNLTNVYKRWQPHQIKAD